MIEVLDLKKQYGKMTALNGVSFSVKVGEILGFLGPNGAGKTTAMRIITGYLPATSGTVKVAGFDVMRQSLEVRRRIGYLPETVPLYEDMTVGESMRFYAELRGVEKSTIAERISDVLESCGINEVRNKLIRTLSKGYRQRVGLAQALINDPEILILDEPTIGLDPKQIIEIRELIKSFSGKRTVILSSHILPEVSVVCDRIAIIHKGNLIAIDTEEKLSARAGGNGRINLTVKGPSGKVAAGLKKIKGVLSLSSKPTATKGVFEYILETDLSNRLRSVLSKYVVENGWDLLGLEVTGVTLEDVFISLVDRHEGGVQ